MNGLFLEKMKISEETKEIFTFFLNNKASPILWSDNYLVDGMEFEIFYEPSSGSTYFWYVLANCLEPFTASYMSST